MAVALSVAIGGAAGTSPPTPAIQADSRDDAGLVWVGTGTTPVATTGTDWAPTNPLLTITLGGNYSSNTVDEGTVPRVVVQFLGVSAQSAGCYVVSVTSNKIVIGCKNAPTASLPAAAPTSGVQTGGIGVCWHMDV